MLLGGLCLCNFRAKGSCSPTQPPQLQRGKVCAELSLSAAPHPSLRLKHVRSPIQTSSVLQEGRNFFPPQQFVSAQGRCYKPVIQLQAQQGVQSCTKELQKNHPTSRKAGKAQSHLPEYLGSKICTEKSSQVCLWQKLEDATDEKCPMSNESLNPNQTKSLW